MVVPPPSRASRRAFTTGAAGVVSVPALPFADPRLEAIPGWWSAPLVGLTLTFHQPHRSPGAWDIYLEGLAACYTKLGTEMLAERSLVEAQGCPVFMLATNSSGDVVAGVRATGPYDPGTIDRMPMVNDLAGGPSGEAIATRATKLAADGGVVEAKGLWTAPGVSGLGLPLILTTYHLMAWTGAAHACSSAGQDHVLSRCDQAGAWTEPDLLGTEGFPTPAYTSIPIFWSRSRLLGLPEALIDHLTAQARYLEPFRPVAGATTGAAHRFVCSEHDVADLAADGVRIVDHLDEQTTELAEIDATSTGLAANAVHPWVHLPWRNELVRVLGPEWFSTVRLDRNHNKITIEEERRLAQARIGVVGLSVGASVAAGLAMEGIGGELRIADFDHLALSNLNRLPGSVADVGRPKAEILARRLIETNPYLRVVAYEDGIEADGIDEFLDGLDLVVEVCDSLDMKLLVRRRARAAGVPVLMDTSDRGLLDVERFDQGPAPLLHGLVEGLEDADLSSLTTAEKMPYVLRILEAEQLSARLGASMVEIDATLRSWPQLYSEVLLGSALTVTAARAVLLDHPLPSGRVRIDAEQILTEASRPAPTASTGSEDHAPPPLVRRPPLPERFEEAIVEAAARAPSGGNVQPWRFRLEPDRFIVERRNLEPVGLDIAGRGTLVACGAALANAWVVAAHHGRLLPGSDRPVVPPDSSWPVVGYLDLVDGGRAEERDRRRDRPSIAATPLADLLPAVSSRVSNRHRGGRRAIDPERVAALTRVCEELGVELHYLPSPELAGPVSEAWAESDRVRFLTPRLHHELFSELKRPGVDRDLGAGLDLRTLELPTDDEAALDLLRRPDVVAELNRWDAGSRLSRIGRRQLEHSAGMILITVDGATAGDHVAAGVAMEIMWLTAVGLGLRVHPMTPLFTYANNADELASIVGLDRAGRLFQHRKRAMAAFGADPARSMVITFRVHEGPEPSAISARLDTDSVVAD